MSSLSIKRREGNHAARKYRVDYAVKKDRSVSPLKYLVFFKTRDADALTAAFTEYSKKVSSGKQSVRLFLTSCGASSRSREIKPSSAPATRIRGWSYDKDQRQKADSHLARAAYHEQQTEGPPDHTEQKRTGRRRFWQRQDTVLAETKPDAMYVKTYPTSFVAIYPKEIFILEYF